MVRDKQPRKVRNANEGWLNVSKEDGKLKLQARWVDRDGATHDCGFVLAPSWNAAREHARILAEAVIDAAMRAASAKDGAK